MKPNIKEKKAVRSVVYWQLCAIVAMAVLITFVAAKTFEYNPIPTFNNSPSRPINSSFKPHLYKASICTYTVNIVTALSLLNLNSSGMVYLEISQDGSTWMTINSAGVTKALAVSLSVGLNETTAFNVQGVCPANWFCRLRTVTSGGATVSFASGQEVMY